MKIFTIPAVMAMLTGTAFAHSWLECVDTRVSNKAAAKADPANVPPVQVCKGYPRNKVNNGDWIAESTNYVYNFSEKPACRLEQREPGKEGPNAPMATASPGDKLLMRFWGNGHSSYSIGSPLHRDPGLVRIFWAGRPETEIEDASDLSEMNWIPGAQANFSGDAINYVNKEGRFVEPANYFEFTVPKNIQNGRHMMVWAWAWKKSMIKSGTHGDPKTFDNGWDNAWGTCFDLQIVGSKFTEAASPDILRNQKGFSKTNLEKQRQEEICTPACYPGGMSAPCTGGACPPCRYSNNNDDKTACYAYVSEGKCPFASGWDCKTGTSAVFDPPATHARKHRARRF